jgi:phage-related protein
MATFTVAPDYQAQLDEQPRTITAKFGDGYEQRAADGINVRPRKWSLKFENRSNTDRDTVLTFFRTHNAVTAFDWTPPEGAAGKFVCRAWQNVPVQYNLNTITAVFEEVFEV